MNEKDLEKLALLGSIRDQASHLIDSEKLKTCPYDHIVVNAQDTIQSEVSADIANELGLNSKGTPRCQTRRKR